MAIAYTVACFIYFEFGEETCQLTSGTEGVHGRASLHFPGQGIDLKRPIAAEQIEVALKVHLGDEFDVVLESDHIHIEFQPKKGVNQ